MRLIVCAWLLASTLAFAQVFADMTENRWSTSAIDELVDLGIFVGYPDGFFRGQEDVSREEAATMLSRLLYAIDETRVESLQQSLAELEATLALLESNALAADTQLQLGLVDIQEANQVQLDTVLRN